MPVELTKRARAELEKVNRQVNEDTTYRTDMELYGKEELWAVANSEGDCEDYALEKRRRLLELGWPQEALRLAVCRIGNEGHAVLTVDTDKGTYVLDNNYDDIQRWASLPYQWIMRQAESGPGWVSLTYN